MRLTIFICSLFLLSGCATIITGGSNQDVYFNSEPPGSIVEINGHNSGTTPCVVKMSKKSNYSVILKQNNYKDHYIYLNKEFEPIFFGNIFLGGPLGMLVDICTGAVYKLSPTQNFVKMENEKNFKNAILDRQ